MKVLVTGGSGFLGRRTAGYLETLGWQVLAPGHGSLDITREEDMMAWFRKNRPEAVIHTAAVSDTGLCQRKPEWSEEINVTGSVNLAGNPKLSWDKVDGAVSYKVYRATSADGEYKLMKTTTGTSYTNTNNKAGTTYRYYIVAVAEKTSANSAASNVVKLTAK